MYTSHIGRKFLRYYNFKNQIDLTAKQFFDEVMFPLFFDDEKHLMHVGNSAFFQRPAKKILEKGLTKSQAQLEKFHFDVENEPPNMATFVGYAAKDVEGTTSGQLTDMDFKIDSEEMHLSWIGQSLSIGVSGGFVIAIDDEELLFSLFQGFKHYRTFLNDTPKVKDRQIETWNGNWLIHRYSNDYDPENVWNNFEIETKNENNVISIPTIQWSKIIFTLSKIFPNEEMIVYAYNLSQTNTTLGFLKVYFPQVQRMYQLRDKIFLDKEKSILIDSEIESLETFYHFKSACIKGSIGLSALEPRGLRDFLPNRSYKYSKGKEFKLSEKNYSTYLIYKLWVTAMLNKTELLELAGKMASVLLANEAGDTGASRGKTVKSRESLQILDSKNVKLFIEHLAEMIEKAPANASLLKEVVNEILVMPVDNFPLFITLIKFEYNYQKYSGEKK